MAVDYQGALEHFRTLELDPAATDEEIREAYLRLVRCNHPDCNLGDPDAEARFKKIQRAYERLSEPGALAKHRRFLNTPFKKHLGEAPTFAHYAAANASIGAGGPTRRGRRWPAVAIAGIILAAVTGRLSSGPNRVPLVIVAPPSGALILSSSEKVPSLATVLADLFSRPDTSDFSLHESLSADPQVGAALGLHPEQRTSISDDPADSRGESAPPLKGVMLDSASSESTSDTLSSLVDQMSRRLPSPAWLAPASGNGTFHDGALGQARSTDAELGHFDQFSGDVSSAGQPLSLEFIPSPLPPLPSLPAVPSAYPNGAQPVAALPSPRKMFQGTSSSNVWSEPTMAGLFRAAAPTATRALDFAGDSWGDSWQPAPTLKPPVLDVSAIDPWPTHRSALAGATDWRTDDSHSTHVMPSRREYLQPELPAHDLGRVQKRWNYGRGADEFRSRPSLPMGFELGSSQRWSSESSVVPTSYESPSFSSSRFESSSFASNTLEITPIPRPQKDSPSWSIPEAPVGGGSWPQYRPLPENHRLPRVRARPGYQPVPLSTVRTGRNRSGPSGVSARSTSRGATSKGTISTRSGAPLPAVVPMHASGPW